MKKRTLISTTAGLAVAAMLMGAGFVATAHAAEVNSNDITITQPQTSAVSNLIQPTVNGRTFKAYRISDYSNAQVNDDGQITGYDMKVTNGFTDALIRDAVKAAIVSEDGTETTLTNEQYTVDVTNGTSDVENTKNINDFAKTGGVIMTMLALAGALALWMAVFCFFSMS